MGKYGFLRSLGALVVACKTDMGDLSFDDFSRWKVPTYNNKMLPISINKVKVSQLITLRL